MHSYGLMLNNGLLPISTYTTDAFLRAIHVCAITLSDTHQKITASTVQMLYGAGRHDSALLINYFLAQIVHHPYTDQVFGRIASRVIRGKLRESERERENIELFNQLILINTQKRAIHKDPAH